MSMSDARSQVCQFQAALYPANLEESLAAAPGNVASINVITIELEG